VGFVGVAEMLVGEAVDATLQTFDQFLESVEVTPGGLANELGSAQGSVA